MIGDPRTKRERANPTEIVKLESTAPKEVVAAPITTRDIETIETEALALCLRYVRGESVLDRLYTVLSERAYIIS